MEKTLVVTRKLSFLDKKGVAMVLCRSMGPVSSKDVFPRRSVAAKMFNLKPNEILQLVLYSNLGFNLHYQQKNVQKYDKFLKGKIQP